VAAPVSSHHAYFDYKTKHIEFHFWTREAVQTPDTILFLGVGQSGKIPKWIAQQAPAGVVVVEGLPHWHADASPQELEIFAKGYAQAALHAICDTFHISSVNIVASSQAAYAAVQLCLDQPDAIKNVGLMFPLGLTTQSLGRTAAERLKNFKKRILQTLLQPEQSPFYDIHNLYFAYQLVRTVLADKKGVANEKFALALSYDVLPDIKKLAHQQSQRGYHITIALAGKDKIFRSVEIKLRLQNHSLPGLNIIEFAEATHSSLALRSNRLRVQEIIEHVRSNASQPMSAQEYLR
jgi:pimeloyl-ACP methyl ester carboxylesterase